MFVCGGERRNTTGKKLSSTPTARRAIGGVPGGQGLLQGGRLAAWRRVVSHSNRCWLAMPEGATVTLSYLPGGDGRRG